MQKTQQSYVSHKMPKSIVDRPEQERPSQQSHKGSGHLVYCEHDGRCVRYGVEEVLCLTRELLKKEMLAGIT